MQTIQTKDKKKLIELIKKDPFLIRYLSVSDLSVSDKLEIQLIAVNENSNAIAFIKNPTLNVQMNVIKKDPSLYGYINNIHPDVKKYMEKNVRDYLEYSDSGRLVVRYKQFHVYDLLHQSYEDQVESIKNNPRLIYFLNSETEEMQMTAVTRQLDTIEYIKEPTENVQLYVVKNNSRYISYIKNPTKKTQLYAVRADIDNITLIKNPCEMVLLYMVVTDPSYLSDYEDVSEIVALTAVKYDAYSINYLDNPSDKIQVLAVKKNSSTISLFHNQCEEAQLISLKDDVYNLNYIYEPTYKAKKYAITKNYKMMYVLYKKNIFKQRPIDYGITEDMYKIYFDSLSLSLKREI